MTSTLQDLPFAFFLTPCSRRCGPVTLSRVRCAAASGLTSKTSKRPLNPNETEPLAVGKITDLGKRGISHPGLKRTEISDRVTWAKLKKLRRNPSLESMETNQELNSECRRISQIESEIGSLVSTKRAVIFLKKDKEGKFAKVKEIFQSMNVDLAVHDLDGLGDHGRNVEKCIRRVFSVEEFPAVFLNGAYFGNLDDVIQAEASGQLEATVGAEAPTYDFDLFVIGGGSGGLAAAKEASRLGKRVAVADFVDPTPLGKSWGLGGTCVNVGCIPKKLMHQASLFGESVAGMALFGWNDVSIGKHHWLTLIKNVQNHIRLLNWTTKKELKKRSVEYFNSCASIIDPHSVKLVNLKEATRTVTTRNILIATGTRPKYPDIPNARELCITSDDIFSLKYPPCKTLVVGSSYVGLECAGFLRGLGFDTTVVVKTRVLNGFDEQMAHLVRIRMEDREIKFLDEYQLSEIQREADGEPPTLRVTCKHGKSGNIVVDNYNTVLLAIGRLPQLTKLGIENVGIAVNKESGRIIGDENERTSVRNVYVVGDVLDGRPELTPVAIRAGILLSRVRTAFTSKIQHYKMFCFENDGLVMDIGAQRLFSKSRELMCYDLVPTTVFTPVEYGAVGLSEEMAYNKFKSAVRVYHSTFKPYHHKMDLNDDYRSYAKIICVQCPKNWKLFDPLEESTAGDSTSERVIGFHVLCPSAGEVTQGFGVAMRMGLTLEDLERSIGIHPTIAEVFLRLKVKLEGDLGEEAVCCS